MKLFEFFEIERIEQVRSQVGKALEAFQFFGFPRADVTFDVTADETTASPVRFRPIVCDGKEIAKMNRFIKMLWEIAVEPKWYSPSFVTGEQVQQLPFQVCRQVIQIKNCRINSHKEFLRRASVFLLEQRAPVCLG